MAQGKNVLWIFSPGLQPVNWFIFQEEPSHPHSRHKAGVHFFSESPGHISTHGKRQILSPGRLVSSPGLLWVHKNNLHRSTVYVLVCFLLLQQNVWGLVLYKENSCNQFIVLQILDHNTSVAQLCWGPCSRQHHCGRGKWELSWASCHVQNWDSSGKAMLPPNVSFWWEFAQKIGINPIWGWGPCDPIT